MEHCRTDAGSIFAIKSRTDVLVRFKVGWSTYVITCIMHWFTKVASHFVPTLGVMESSTRMQRSAKLGRVPGQAEGKVLLACYQHTPCAAYSTVAARHGGLQPGFIVYHLLCWFREAATASIVWQLPRRAHTCWSQICTCLWTSWSVLYQSVVL